MNLGSSRTRRRIKPFAGVAPSSPRPSLLSSWLLKFRRMGIDRSDHGRGRQDRRTRPGNSSPAPTRHYNSPSEVVSPPSGGVEGGEEEGRSLEGDGGFWRLSFRGRRVFDAEGDFSGDLRGPIWCRSDGDKETHNFEEMVSGIRRRRESQRRSKSLPEIKVESAEREAELKTPRRRKVKKEHKFGIRSDKKVLESKNQDRVPSNYSISSRKSVDDSEFPSPETQKPEETSDGDDTSREKQRKSLYISRRELPRRRPKQSSRVQVHSPRTTRIEAGRPRSPAEDMKEANSKSTRTRTKTKKGGAGGTKANRLEKFAVVKCSYDPQRDFRESMMEMIVERRIRRSEDMEELLACYLTLNSDEYHHLIIKVFRQVWFELNQACVDW